MTSQPTATIERIGAETAAKYLECMVADQRSKKNSQISRFVQELIGGNWELVPDAIAFNSKGELWNGQHRMQALVEAAKIQPDIEADFIVLRSGSETEAMDVTDQGIKRTLADTIFRKYAPLNPKSHTGSWAVEIAAIARRAYLLDTNRWRNRNNVPITALLNWIDENQGIFSLNNIGESIYRKIGGNAPTYAALYYLIARDCDKTKADEFFAELKKTNHPDGHPIFAMQRRLANLNRQGVTMPNEFHIHLLIRTWNSWLKGDTVKMIRVDPTDPFPSWTAVWQGLND